MVSVVAGLDFCGGAVAELGVQALVVPPPHPFQRRELDLLDRSPGSSTTDQLGFVKPVDRLRESIVRAGAAIAVWRAPAIWSAFTKSAPFLGNSFHQTGAWFASRIATNGAVRPSWLGGRLGFSVSVSAGVNGRAGVQEWIVRGGHTTHYFFRAR